MFSGKPAGRFPASQDAWKNLFELQFWQDGPLKAAIQGEFALFNLLETSQEIVAVRIVPDEINFVISDP